MSRFTTNTESNKVMPLRSCNKIDKWLLHQSPQNPTSFSVRYIDKLIDYKHICCCVVRIIGFRLRAIISFVKSRESLFLIINRNIYYYLERIITLKWNDAYFYALQEKSEEYLKWNHFFLVNGGNLLHEKIVQIDKECAGYFKRLVSFYWITTMTFLR